jgi:hypothetical protein
MRWAVKGCWTGHWVGICWSGHGLGWARRVLSWARDSAQPDTGRPERVLFCFTSDLGSPWAELDMEWAGHGLGCPHAALTMGAVAMGWALDVLGWTCARLDTGLSGQGLGWEWAKQTMNWSGLVMVWARLAIGWSLLGWP